MSTIDELKGIRYCRLEIELYRERIARLRSAAEGVTVLLKEGTSGTSEHDRVSAQVAQIIDMENQLLQKIVDCESRILDVEQAVDRLPAGQRTVMRLRYIEGLSWEQVAKVMNYSPRRCLQIHEEGIHILCTTDSREMYRNTTKFEECE